MKIIAILISILSIFSAETVFSAEKPLVRFGVIPRYNPLVMYKRYQPIMDYLTAETPYRFELKISKDYPEAVRFLREGVTQVSSLGDVTFAKPVSSTPPSRSSNPATRMASPSIAAPSLCGPIPPCRRSRNYGARPWPSGPPTPPREI